LSSSATAGTGAVFNYGFNKPAASAAKNEATFSAVSPLELKSLRRYLMLLTTRIPHWTAAQPIFWV